MSAIAIDTAKPPSAMTTRSSGTRTAALVARWRTPAYRP
jgi:hypothetical protein